MSANFIVEFPLRTEPFQNYILNKRFEIGRKMYNALVCITTKRLRELERRKYYKKLLLEAREDKSIYKKVNQLRKDFLLSEYDFQKDIKPIQQHYKNNIDSSTAQKIATTLWKAYSSYFYDKGKTIHYRRYDCFNCLEGKSNKTGIKFQNGYINWNGLHLKVVIDKNNPYEQACFGNDISYCRLVRKWVRNKYKYYVQIVFKGIPPIKINKSTGEIKHIIGNGDVGIDIGTSTIAISSKNDVKIFELADRVKSIENAKRRLLRKLDRSRRATNPNNYNSDGTIKKQGNKKVIWVKSNHYKKYQNELKELYRKQAAVRKYQHECLANYIIPLGDKFYVEKMNFSALQKRSSKTEKNQKGKFKKKKRFGKSLGNRAPAMLLSIINRKLICSGTKLIEINTQKARASQFNHFDETYKKKKLSQRWNNFNGVKVQRDIYSAFLIMNISSDLKSFDMNKCNDRFNNFKTLHDREVERLRTHKNLSSIGI